MPLARGALMACMKRSRRLLSRVAVPCCSGYAKAIANAITSAILVRRRPPCDPHHLKFVQPRELGRKVSDWAY
jgi:hypothetical protein